MPPKRYIPHVARQRSAAYVQLGAAAGRRPGRGWARAGIGSAEGHRMADRRARGGDLRSMGGADLAASAPARLDRRGARRLARRLALLLAARDHSWPSDALAPRQ